MMFIEDILFSEVILSENHVIFRICVRNSYDCYYWDCCCYCCWRWAGWHNSNSNNSWSASGTKQALFTSDEPVIQFTSNHNYLKHAPTTQQHHTSVRRVQQQQPGLFCCCWSTTHNINVWLQPINKICNQCVYWVLQDQSRFICR